MIPATDLYQKDSTMKWQWILFVIGTAACWGAYVPMLHEGQNAIGATKGTLSAF